MSAEFLNLFLSSPNVIRTLVPENIFFDEDVYILTRDDMADYHIQEHIYEYAKSYRIFKNSVVHCIHSAAIIDYKYNDFEDVVDADYEIRVNGVQGGRGIIERMQWPFIQAIKTLPQPIFEEILPEFLFCWPSRTNYQQFE